MVENSRTTGGTIAERVAAGHGEMAWAAHCIQGWSVPVVFSTGL